MQATQESLNWHEMDVEEAFGRLKSRPEGLSISETEERLQKFGPNELFVEKGPTPIDILIRLNRDPLIYVLFGAGIVAALLGEYVDMAVILTVVVLNSTIGFIQEYKAEQSLRALAKLAAPRARVVRDGEQREIDALLVVPGDVVYVESGMKVPADVRLFRVVDLQVDESILTGESQPVGKGTDPIPDANAPLGDRKSMAFMSTVVVRGRGYGLVTATAQGSVFGAISRQVQQVGETRTPLQRRLSGLARLIALLVLGVSLIVVVLGLLVGESLGEVLLTAVATAVATVPEGLPVTVTVALAVGVGRMAQRHAIIRKLPAVETLGSCTTICSDKTGTLTKNEMTVTKVWAGGRMFDVTGAGYSPVGLVEVEGEPVDFPDHPGLEWVLRIGLLANESSVYREDDQYHVSGDPTEGALIVAADKAGLNLEAEYESYPQLDLLPFESDRRYMATLHGHGDRRLIFVKGAPEKVIEMCRSEFGGPDGFDREAALRTSRELAGQGLRVLAMAFALAPEGQQQIDHALISKGLVFLGLQGMIDPPRPEAIDAVAKAKQAGIRVIMITGDYQVTARAIAERMGIVPAGPGKEEPEVVDGHELEQMDDEELFRRVKDVPVYARANPEHKLRIVQQLRRHEEVVALTGDGVNDAPALKAADIGIAMGRSGTDVAKEASDMVLTDDNFATIYAAVEEGRVVFDNIRKVVMFLIPTGLGLVLTIIGSIFLGLPLPFLPAQIIWINLVTNGLQDVAMAFEPAEGDVGRRRPRGVREGVLNRLMVERTIVVGLVLLAGTLGVFVWQLGAGASLEYARTVALTTMVLFQNFHIFNSRSFRQSFLRMSPSSNRFLLAAIVGALGLHFAALYLPPLQFVLRTEPLALETWPVLIAIAASVLLVVEIDKLIRRRVFRSGC